MARDKNQRDLNFKPLFKHFGQDEIENSGEITLLHEEIEAIYLMDLLGLYQEDAAKKMNVSRPTFSRIVKSARHKIANCLVTGAKLNIHDQKDSYIIAICSDETNSFSNTGAFAKYIHIYEIKNDDYFLLEVIENPVHFENKKPGMALPKIFIEKNINFFITNEIGVGLKNSLLSKGIYTILKKNISQKDLKNIPV